MRRLLIAPLILALSSPAFAGIPESLNPTKWMRINDAWLIDTEDIELKGSKLRFYIEREARKDEIGDNDYRVSYVGKLRLRCSDFSTKIESREEGPFGSYYQGGAWEKIRPELMAYKLANYFCFLTSVEGYTREEEEPDWVEKIIETVQSKPISKSNQANINCDSPAWRNRPQCIDY